MMLWQSQIAMLALLFTCSCFPPVKHQSPAQEAMEETLLVSLLSEATLRMRDGDNDSLDLASGALELARELRPKDARVLDGLGCLEWRRGNFLLAERLFRRAMEENPRYDRAYAHLALISAQRGKRGEAIEFLRTAVSLNPMNYRARNNLAVALVESDDSGRGRQSAYAELLKAFHGGGREERIVNENLQTLNSELSD